jgi:hypothetical protein
LAILMDPNQNYKKKKKIPEDGRGGRNMQESK